jgi:hypothetical protein
MPNAKSKHEFFICVRNDGYPASLQTHKIYRLMQDKEAASHKMMRVVDESGEDYLYPEDFFIRIELPQVAEA